MTITFQADDSAPVCAVNVYCSGGSLGSSGTGVPQIIECESGAAGTSTTTTVTCEKSTSTFVYVNFECPVPAGATWGSGTWTVKINITTANNNITIKAIYICRVNSSCVSQASIGSATGLSISLGSAGVISQNIAGSAQTPSSGDKVIVVFELASSNSMTAEAFAFDHSSGNTEIISPFTPGAQAFAQSLSESVSVTTVGPKDVSLLSTLQEAATTLDQFFKGIIQFGLSESAASLDSFTKDASLLSSLQEKVTALAELFQLHEQSLSESISTTSQFTKVSTYFSTLLESVNSLSQLSKDVGLLSTLQESAISLDQLVKDASLLSTLQEMASTLDQLTLALSTPTTGVNLTETVATLDQLLKGINPAGLSETIAVLGEFIKDVSALSAQQESIVVLGQLSKGISLLSTLLEALITLEQLVKGMTPTSPGEGVTTLDSLNFFSEHYYASSETVASSADLLFLYNPTPQETVAALDQLTLLLVVAPTIVSKAMHGIIYPREKSRASAT